MIDNRYHFEGKDKQGKAIVIDLADLNSLDRMSRAYPYELMVMRPHGAEIASSIYNNLADAEQAYNNAVTLYTLKEGENPPLKGKYAKLKADLAEALKIGRQAAEGHDDGGTCNLDSPALALPRWQEALVEQAAKEAGTHCFKWKLYGSTMYVFATPSVGQANRNTIAAEAMTEFLKQRGYATFCYQQAD